MKIDNINWQKIEVHNPVRPPPNPIMHPADFFRKHVGKVGIGEYMFRQTGRTTYMILKALADIKKGKTVAIMTHAQHMAQRIGTDLTDYGNQLGMNLGYSKGMVVQFNMDRSRSRDAVYFFTPAHGLNDLRGRSYDMIYLDNAIRDTSLDVNHVYREASRLGIDMELPKMKNEASVITSDGVEFKRGDLVRMGDKLGMLCEFKKACDLDLVDTISLLVEEELLDIPTETVELLGSIE